MLLFDELRLRLPDTAVFVESILPVDSIQNPFLDNKDNKAVNKMISVLCGRYSFSYIHIYPEFLNENGMIKQEYSSDGLHLSVKGIKHWLECISDYVEGESAVRTAQDRQVIDIAASVQREDVKVNDVLSFEVGKMTKAKQLF